MGSWKHTTILLSGLRYVFNGKGTYIFIQLVLWNSVPQIVLEGKLKKGFKEGGWKIIFKFTDAFKHNHPAAFSDSEVLIFMHHRS